MINASFRHCLIYLPLLCLFKICYTKWITCAKTKYNEFIPTMVFHCLLLLLLVECRMIKGKRKRSCSVLWKKLLHLQKKNVTSMIISKFWCHENETGSLNFGPLRKRYLSLSFCTILRYPVTTWPHGAYRNSEPGQVQGKGFWERLLKSICCRLLL